MNNGYPAPPGLGAPAAGFIITNLDAPDAFFLGHIVDVQLLVQVWGQVPINPGLKRMSSEIGDRIRSMFTDYLTEWHAQAMPGEAARARALRESSVYMSLVQGYVIQTVLFDGFDGPTYLDVVDGLSLSGPATTAE